MRDLSRRAFLTVASTAAAWGASGLAQPDAAEASTPSDVAGFIHDQGGEVFNIRNPAYNASGNTALGSDGTIASGSHYFTVGTARFTAADVGKVITVQGAGASGTVLSTTITAYNNVTRVTLADAAAQTALNTSYAYGNDDTAAILAAIQAAGSSGKLYAPPGIYMILGASNNGAPIEMSGAGGLFGAGAKTSGTSVVTNTVFLCGDATAGLLANGTATYRGFLCDGNNIAVTPLQNGKLVDGVAQDDSRNAKFLAVWVYNSTGHGWTIYGAQGNAYYDCNARYNAAAGVYIDGGAGDLSFWHWEEQDNAQYGIYGDKVVPGGSGTYGDHTENVRFYGGICDQNDSTHPSVSKIYLRAATNWSFPALSIVGNGSPTFSGPIIDLDQSSGYGIDFSEAWVYNGTASQPNIMINGSPPSGAAPCTFLIADNVEWETGNQSIQITSSGNYRYAGRGWMLDLAPAGPTGGADGNTLIMGRTGPWITPSIDTNQWSADITYRINSDGSAQLKGQATAVSTVSGGYLFTLDPGYRPDHTVSIPVAHDGSTVDVVTITPDGVVTAPNVAAQQTVHLGGISFPVR